MPKSGRSLIANFSLSAELPQLNRKIDYPNTPQADQLPTLDSIGLFDAPLDLDKLDTLPSLVDAYDRNQDLTARARSYLHANCSGCHVPSRFSDMDFRFTTPLEKMAMCDVEPNKDFDIVDARIIAPGDPGRSTMLQRVKSLMPGMRMPPLHKTVVDDEAVLLLTQWIMSIQPEDCIDPDAVADDAAGDGAAANGGARE